MSHTVSATEARIHFGELLQRVVRQGDRITIERAGKPQAVMLSVDDFERLLSASRQAPDWQELLVSARALIQFELRGQRLPSPDEIVRQGREQRDEQLSHLR